jgi:perosamine synthetase
VNVRLAQPMLGEPELAGVAAVLASGFLTMGPEVVGFEQDLADACGTEFAVAVSSGTAALHLAVLAADLGPDDDVIVPAYTFPATANVVRLAGARVVFCDVDPQTGVAGRDEIAAVLTPQTRAILGVHLFGFPLDMDPLLELARDNDAVVIEDAAGALGSLDRGRPIGGLGLAGCLSFHPRKLVTTGEGGAIVTNDAAVAARCRRLRHHGIEGGVLHEPGYNYRLSDIHAVIGRPQVARLADIVARRQELAVAYDELLRDVPGVAAPPRPSAGRSARHSWQAYVTQLDPVIRDEVLASLRGDGVEVQVGTYDVATQPAYGEDAAAFPGARLRAGGDLALPFHELLQPAEMEHVVEALGVAVGVASP